ncbi:Peroxidase [Thalictrum thalictroides]|uniref:peroxidase n=1 Tax=Thalictrum thalictroides TaxID=46969 RepID=A0A7J6X5Y4_THATH|nr:Peroxidase [Thalictrum thalictroides]
MATDPSKLFVLIIFFTTISTPVLAQLTVGFYASTCPSVFDTVRSATRSAINREARMGASLIRLHFHDCFVNGCDGGILLDDTTSVPGEKGVLGNANSVRGFEVIDTIKTQVDRACGRPVVSCADILAIAARDSVVELGGPSYSIPVGRRDARSPSRDGTTSLPGFFEDLDPLLRKFSDKGFTAREMVALSGAHTVGQARCAVYRNRIYNDTNIDPAYAASLQTNCPRATGTNDNTLAPLDPQSPNRFGNNYFQALLNRRTILRSDQELFNGGSTDSIVRDYSDNPSTFSTDFANAMVKMGNLSPLTAFAQLSVSFYGSTCPSVFDTVRAATRSAINSETRMGASILRLFFHDCFVGGCDGGILVSGGERNAPASVGTVRGFDVIDNIKRQVDTACGQSVVSCADILAISARDSIVELGGQSYSVPLGRRDTRTPNLDAARSDLPSPFDPLNVIIDKFSRKGFSAREMVALSGAHTVGQAQCSSFKDRIYNDTNIDPDFAATRRANCPQTGGDSNLAPLDPQSQDRVDNNYFQALLNRRGLLSSDQALFNGGSTDSIVRTYSNDANAFLTDFTNAMVKMGNLSPLTGNQGEIRTTCQQVN